MTFHEAVLLGFGFILTVVICVYLIVFYFLDKKENEEIEKRIRKLENSKKDDNMKKQLDYFELWDLAFKEKDRFNKKYFDYYIRRSKEYQECSVVVTDEIIDAGLPFEVDGIKFTIAPDDYENKDYLVIKKYRVDKWTNILKQAKNQRI